MIDDRQDNLHAETVSGFGDEWERFDQSALSAAESARIFNDYFSLFPWSDLSANAEGFDLGCGSGRWARLVAPRVGRLHCVDPSAAIHVAKRLLAEQPNCAFHQASVDALPFADHSMDFGYSLGVLHHVPDTGQALADCVRKLKPGAPFLLYLYYAFDNRPLWFKTLWKASDLARGVISRLPHGARYLTSQAIAGAVYWPLARGARAVERLGLPADHLPLAFYRDRSFYVMRTDALDRFGTQLEQRFTRAEIQALMEQAGLKNIRFRDDVPFWCACGIAE